MLLGKIVGSITSSSKHDAYNGKTVFLVRPIYPDGTVKSGTMIAVDTVGAGEGDIVLVSSEGRAAQEILEFKTRQPLRSIILAIVDQIDHRTTRLPNHDR
ncbi:MAG: EutN/CcmL family microcompartment protein [bacterium]